MRLEVTTDMLADQAIVVVPHLAAVEPVVKDLLLQLLQPNL